jgi:uncharacterized protein (DUF58 family)
MILGRANHYLARKAQRDRYRKGWLSSAIEPFVDVLRATTVEGKGAIVLALVAGGLGLEVGSTQVYLVWAALVAVLVAAFVVRRPFHLLGTRLSVSAPRRVTVGEESSFTILLHNDSARAHHSVRLAAPYLSWDGRWTTEMPAIGTIGAGESVRVECRARFTQRGQHQLEPFRAGAVVPLGLTLGRLVQSPPCRFMVVPKLARVERLTVPSSRRYQPGGIALASKTGESLDLLGVRPYRPGDPVRDLHARTWARVGTPVVREYQQQYYSRLAVVVDTDLGTASRRQFEAALSLAAGVVAHLGRGESLIDLLVVGAHAHELTLGRSLGQLEQALDLLACVRPGPAFDPARLAERITPHLPRLSCVIFVALRDDKPRAQLAQHIESRGVSCRVLLVEPPAARGHRPAQGAPVAMQFRNAVRVGTGAVEGGEALWL